VPSKKQRLTNDSRAAVAPPTLGASKAPFILTCAALIAINLIAYASVGHLGFVDYDDGEYVTANSHVLAGLTFSSVRWALTSGYFANWHPLTWISHMLDVQLFGLNAGAHHSVNLLFHIANTLLLFAVLNRMTGAMWRSAFVAALFGVHPLHVESVAWIAERKDTLSTLFWMLTLWAYVGYVRHPCWRHYAAVFAFLALGLMAKPMLVTLPLVLLLLDVWPLRRTIGIQLITEKLPLFALVAASSVITVLVQREAGAVAGLSQAPLSLRAANAVVAYARYLGKMFWPVDLVVMYPLPRELPSVGLLVGALAIMAGISLLVLFAARRRPYLLVGWLWYVVTLIPVIGIVQVGAQAMADRYTYVPLIGLFVMIAWGVPEVLASWSPRQAALQLVSAVLIATCAALSFRQVQYWRTSKTLWEHAVEATPTNYFAHGSLGYVLWKGGKADEAIPHYTESLRLRPDFPEAHNNLGVALAGQGRLSDALPHFSEAIRLKPGYAAAEKNLAATSARFHAPDDELSRYAEAVRAKPNDLAAHNEFGVALAAQGRIDEAIQQFGEALRINKAEADVHYNLGMMLDKKGRTKDAIEEFRSALRYNPKHVSAQEAITAIASRPSSGAK
jgi:tetratricopeptide (TPR) repeat protein